METLEIKNFLTIKSALLEVKSINIIIGPQATGKSVIAKILYLFQHFLAFDLIECIAGQIAPNQILLQRFQGIFAKENYLNQEFMIKYKLDNLELSIINKPDQKDNFNLSLECSDIFVDLYQKATQFFEQKQLKYDPLDPDKSNDENQAKLYDYIQSETGINLGAIVPIFIPASRDSLIMILHKLLLDPINDLKDLLLIQNQFISDPIFKGFTYYYSVIRDLYSKHNYHNDQIFIKLTKQIHKILGGEYQQVGNQDFLYSQGKKINLIHASSGQQETLPMLLILSLIPFTLTSGENALFFVEEPETHLFPYTQKEVANLLAMIYHNHKKQSKFFLTTHSPYLLTAFNNMIMASVVYQSDQSEEMLNKISTILDPDTMINYEDVIAYTIENGILKSIMNEELQLIGSSIIDEVSDQFNQEFNDLLSLQM